MAVRFEASERNWFESSLEENESNVCSRCVCVCVGPSWRSLEEALQMRRTPVETSLPAVRELMRLQQTLRSGTRPVLPQKQGV